MPYLSCLARLAISVKERPHWLQGYFLVLPETRLWLLLLLNIFSSVDLSEREGESCSSALFEVWFLIAVSESLFKRKLFDEKADSPFNEAESCNFLLRVSLSKISSSSRYSSSSSSSISLEFVPRELLNNSRSRISVKNLNDFV